MEKKVSGTLILKLLLRLSMLLYDFKTATKEPIDDYQQNHFNTNN